MASTPKASQGPRSDHDSRRPALLGHLVKFRDQLWSEFAIPNITVQSGDVTAADVYNVDFSTGDFVQFGWAWNNYGIPSLQHGLRYFTGEANYSYSSGETLSDHGAAPAGKLEYFGLNQNTNRNDKNNYLHYFAWLNGTLVWESKYPYPSQMTPAING